MKLIFYKCDICRSIYKLHSIENEKSKVYPNTLNCLEGHLKGQNISIRSQNISMVLEHMKILVTEKTLEEDYLKLIRQDKLSNFLQSDLAARMKKAFVRKKLYREQPFVLGLAANRVEENFPENEKVLIQGIIDAYFEEEGEVVLVDYKTDAITKPEELINRYRTQMDYYKEALEKLTGRKVKERILYSFALNEEIII